MVSFPFNAYIVFFLQIYEERHNKKSKEISKNSLHFFNKSSQIALEKSIQSNNDKYMTLLIGVVEKTRIQHQKFCITSSMN